MDVIEDLLLKGYIDESLNENVENATADYLVQLLTYCAKADKEISPEERDYIINYIESFDMNNSEETWLFAQYDYGRFHDYNKEIIISLKKSVNKLLDKKNLDFKMLYYLISLCLINNESLNEAQSQIISDFINIFKLDPNTCDKIYNKVYKGKNNKTEEYNNNKNYSDDRCNLDKHYEVLGLNKSATIKDLKKQYAYLTKNYHPDKYSNEEMPLEVRKELEDTYKKINLAYDTLKDII